MMLNRAVLTFLILSAWSIDQSQSLSAFNRSMCHDESVPSVAGMIVRGRVVPRNKWPWLVAFVFKRNNKFFCGGSLVSERFVLTAAHCIQDKKATEPIKPNEVNVFLGKWNLSDAAEPNAVQATPEQFIIHPDWDVRATRWDADIAIVKLSEDVELSDSIQPVCLWTSQMEPQTKNDGGIVVGWGKTENERDGDHSDVPKEASIIGHPIIDCYEIDGLRDVLSRRGLCIGGNGSGPCNGDSGGGFFTAQRGKWFLRGITSVSRLNVVMECDVDEPTIFTNVEKFTSWIDQVLDGDEQLKCFFGFSFGVYSCGMQNSFTRRGTKIYQVIRSQYDSRNSSDVESLESWGNSKLKFLPIALSRFLPNLQSYDVQRSGVEEISRQNFADLPKLKFVWLRSNRLKVIPVDSFYDLPTLHWLDLDGNQIEAIDSCTFIHNTELSHINLENNKISSLHSSIFRNNLELLRVDFSGNLITTIGPEILTPLKKLYTVDFRHNKCIDEGWGKYDSSWSSNLPVLPRSAKDKFKETFARQCQ